MKKIASLFNESVARMIYTRDYLVSTLIKEYVTPSNETIVQQVKG